MEFLFALGIGLGAALGFSAARISNRVPEAAGFVRPLVKGEVFFNIDGQLIKGSEIISFDDEFQKRLNTHIRHMMN